MIKLTRILSLLLVLSLCFFVSCEEKSRNISKDQYLEFYSDTADTLGFDTDTQLITENQTYAFSAFDGIFTVGFTVDSRDNISYLSISASAGFATALETEQQLHEVLLWASYLAMPFYKADYTQYTGTDNATVAGMLLASFDEAVPFDCMVCTSTKDDSGINISFIPT